MAIHYWERGQQRPRPYNGKRLEAALHTPLETLLALDNEKEADTEAPTSKVRQNRNDNSREAVRAV
jgi:hypothetical protein